MDKLQFFVLISDNADYNLLNSVVIATYTKKLEGTICTTKSDQVMLAPVDPLTVLRGAASL